MTNILYALGKAERRVILKNLYEGPLTFTDLLHKSRLRYNFQLLYHLRILAENDLVSQYSPWASLNDAHAFYKLSKKGEKIKFLNTLLERDIKKGLRLLGFKNEKRISKNSIITQKAIIKTLYENKELSTTDLINSSPDIKFKCDKSSKMALKYHLQSMSKILECKKTGREKFYRLKESDDAEFLIKFLFQICERIEKNADYDFYNDFYLKYANL
jgi:hypothetical protein